MAYSETLSSSHGLQTPTVKGNSLFVKGIPKDTWTHRELFDAFSVFGAIRRAKISIGKDHVSRGYGFVEFEEEENCLTAQKEVKSKQD